jgi:hypothetical protein
LRTDSRVLRPKQPKNGRAQASGAKLFWVGEFAAAGAVACAQKRTCAAQAPRNRNIIARADIAKSRISSAFLHDADFFARARTVAQICRRAFYGRALRARRRARGAALTHKIKQSHCYFFSAVVIE